MESNDKLKEISIKNLTCYYYFNDVIKYEDSNLDNILIDGYWYENIVVYKISYKNLIGAKPLCIRFDKIDGLIRGNNESRHLVFFVGEKYGFIYNRIRCLIRVKCGIIYVISHHYIKIKVDSYDSLSLEKHCLCIIL